MLSLLLYSARLALHVTFLPLADDDEHRPAGSEAASASGKPTWTQPNRVEGVSLGAGLVGQLFLTLLLATKTWESVAVETILALLFLTSAAVPVTYPFATHYSHRHDDEGNEEGQEDEAAASTGAAAAEDKAQTSVAPPTRVQNPLGQETLE